MKNRQPAAPEKSPKNPGAARARHSLAKVSRPRPRNVVRRERLFQLLDKGREARGMWIAAPPGAGKTTLLASYLEDRRLTALWYQVDVGDHDVATFFHYLSEAAAVALPRWKFELPPLTPEYLPNLPVFTRSYFRNLFAQLPQPCLLVLENFHEAEDALSGILRDALGEVPDGMCIVTVSRASAPAQFARLQAARELVVIDAEQLRLSLEETRSIAAFETAVDESTLQRLHATVDGWAAGLVLLLEYHKRHATPIGLGEAATGQVFFDYFAGELFAQASAEARAMLLRTAFLPRLTVKMAQQISGIGEAGKLLDHLHRQHLFTERGTNSEPTYQYHALLREFLIAQVRASCTQTELLTLKRESARLLELDNQVEAACGLYCRIGDWPAAAGLLLTQVPYLLAQGRWQTALQWLQALPQEIVAVEPWLLYWLGAAQLVVGPARARECLEQAFVQFKARDDAAGCYLSLASILDAFYLEWSDLTGSDGWITELEHLLLRHPEFPSPEIEARVMASLMCVEFRQPWHPMLSRWVERALQLMQTCGDPQLRVMLAGLVALHERWRGDFKGLSQVFAELRPAIELRKVPPLLVILWRNYEANYCWLSGKPGVALELVELARAECMTSGIHMLDHFNHAQGAYSALGAGRLDLAEKFIDNMESSVNSARRLDFAHLKFLQSGLALFKADLGQAVDCGEASLKIAQECGMVVAVALSHLGLALALIEGGEFTRALEHVGEALSIARAMKSHMFEHAALMLEADTLLQTGREQEGLVALRAGLSIAREHGCLIIVPWSLPRLMVRLCSAALEADIETGFVHQLIRLHGLKPSSPDVQNWPWPVTLHTFGRFSISINGAPLSFDRKVPKKPIALLKAIVALGGRDVCAAQLTEAQWPDDAGDVVFDALAVNLHRLRKLLGDNDAVSLRDGRVSLDAERCWVDCWAFERLLREAPSGGEAVQERALTLYRGAFLAGDPDEAWAMPMRERLRSKFIRQCGGLAKGYETAGRWQEAIDCYKRGIEVDELAEELYQGLMRCYMQLERQAEGVAVYRRLRQTLSILLGAKPSALSEAMYRQFTN